MRRSSGETTRSLAPPRLVGHARPAARGRASLSGVSRGRQHLRRPARAGDCTKLQRPTLGGMGRSRIRPRTAGLLLALWVAVALPASVLIFAESTKSTVVAGHQAVVSPAFDGYATLDLGPFLPNVRYPSGTRLGADIKLGKTDLQSYEALVDRYATLGTRPEGEVAKIRRALGDMALDSAGSGALVGLAGPALWLMLGARRRSELFAHVTPRRATAFLTAVALAVVALTQPWNRRNPVLEEGTQWRPITSELSGVTIPERAESLEIEAGLITSGTRRLVESALDTYARSLAFYENTVERLGEVEEEIRTPEEDETVALLVSDRHDNIGMDKVARAIGDAGGATVLLDAGDDTSTGSPWEAFSLDSLHAAFADYEHRYAVAGNHDHGDFVGTYFDELGFTTFDGEAVEGPDGIRFLGADDPRSSGLGNWRDETGLSFGEHAARVADVACEYDGEGERIAALLVHDANSGKPALERGCVDLVLGGHVHEQLGPTLVEGENGRDGYTFTTGTTGGAAYAVAMGSKLRRNAMVTLVTFRDGRPVGLQPVVVRTVGDYRVSPYLELDLGDAVVEESDVGLDVEEPETTNGPPEEESP
jgi:hypothetical protein